MSKAMAGSGDERDPLLSELGQRVRSLRERRGMARKALASAAGISERHLANLEYGTGNASVLVLADVASALEAPLAALLGDVTTASPEWLLIREMLEPCSEEQLHDVRKLIANHLGIGQADAGRSRRVALIGLRGAGKTSLGRKLAEHLGFPFIEVGKEIEQVAGCRVGEIQALYGVNAYRRYEKRALEHIIQSNPEAVIAAPGGLVSEAASFNLLLNNCTTVWLQATPEDHMSRVVEQGDMRPIDASSEAMDDLRGILASRVAFYSKAEFHLDTSSQGFERTLQALIGIVKTVLG